MVPPAKVGMLLTLLVFASCERVRTPSAEITATVAPVTRIDPSAPIATATIGLNDPDRQFIRDIGAAISAELLLARIGEERAASPAVKAVAHQIIANLTPL